MEGIVKKSDYLTEFEDILKEALAIGVFISNLEVSNRKTDAVMMRKEHRKFKGRLEAYIKKVTEQSEQFHKKSKI